ncbi:VOC family protein [Tropicimonas marinistellae]|uniref:VOC family protein n=1 Tax=Tropicimonas marinistellae TaxID=1739787 RepID=UPI00082FAFAE|nr:VOC family protein [Tropicimonas marinistellae]
MTHIPPNAAVWFELPVRDMTKAMAFYTEVTGMALQLDETGPNPIAVFQAADMATAVAGHLYPGQPAAEGQGPTVHLATPGKLEDTLERVTAAGGKVLSPAIEIPAGRFAYCQDLDGNSFGAFAAAGG